MSVKVIIMTGKNGPQVSSRNDEIKFVKQPVHLTKIVTEYMDTENASG